MSRIDTPEAPQNRRPRYHAVLMAAFLRGSTVDEAAAAARISRRQTLRWKARYGADLDEARAHLLDAAQAQLREALPATAERVAQSARDVGAAVPVALRRLLEILEKPGADVTDVRLAAATILAASDRASALAFDVYQRLAEHGDLAARLAAVESALEAVLEARGAPPAGPRRPSLVSIPSPK